MLSGRFFKECSHPAEHNFRYELIQYSSIDEKIYLDFTESDISCYKTQVSGNPKTDSIQHVFNINLSSENEVNECLSKIIFGEKLLIKPESAACALFQTPIAIEGLVQHKLVLNDFILDNDLLCLYLFYEDFENSKLFRHHPSYNIVRQALKKSFVFIAFDSKIKFLQAKYLLRDLVANNDIVIPNYKLQYINIIEQWVDVLMTEKYIEDLEVSQLNENNFFNNPEVEIKIVGDLLKILLQKINGNIKDFNRSKIIDPFYKVLSEEILNIEEKIEKFLLRKYDVIGALKITTYGVIEIPLLGYINFVIPILFSLAVLMSLSELVNLALYLKLIFSAVLFSIPGYTIFLYLQIERGADTLKISEKIKLITYGSLLLGYAFIITYLVYSREVSSGYGHIDKALRLLLYSGLISLFTMMIISFYAMFRKLKTGFLQGIVRHSFPRLIIAIVSGWIIFSFTAELILQEFHKKGSEILMGASVIIVIWFFMLNQVKSNAPYYSKRLWGFFFSRITSVVCIAFMISFYVGIIFHLFFIKEVMNNEEYISKINEGINNMTEQNAGLSKLNEQLLSSSLFLNNQMELTGEFDKTSVQHHSIDIRKKIKKNASAKLKTIENKLNFVHTIAKGYKADTILSKTTQDVLLSKYYNHIPLFSTNSLKGIENYERNISNEIAEGCLDFYYNEEDGYRLLTKIDTIGDSLVSLLLNSSTAILEVQDSIYEEVECAKKIWNNPNDKHCNCTHNVCLEEKESRSRMEIQPSPNTTLVLYPRMLIYQALFAMFFGIFSHLILHEKSITEAL